MKKYSYLIVIFLLFINTIVKADYLSSLREEADKGDIISQNNLGHLYLYGSNEYDISKDIDKAIYYLSKLHLKDRLMQ